MHKRYSPRKSKIMDLMVNASIRRHMKERRPVYIKWKGSWHTGELLGCGPTYVYKVSKSVVLCHCLLNIVLCPRGVYCMIVCRFESWRVV